jgi:hypothetical protein
VLKVGESAPMISREKVLSATFVPSVTLIVKVCKDLSATSKGVPCNKPVLEISMPLGNSPEILL